MSGKLKQIVIIAAIVAALAAVACIFVFSNNKKDEEAKLLAAADNYYKALDYDKAIATYNRIIANNNSCADAYIGLADVYIDMGNEAKASEILERGINEAKGANSVADKFKDVFGDESYAELFSPGADVTEEDNLSITESEESETVVTEVSVEDIETENSEAATTTAPVESETAAAVTEVTTTAATAAPVVYTTASATRATTRETTRATSAATKKATVTTTAATTLPITTTTVVTTTTTASYDLDLYDSESLTIKVPNFVGQREDHVVEVASNKGITLERIYEYNDDFGYGRVFNQSFKNGDKIAPGMIMYVYVSLGKKDVQTEAPVVTTTAATFKSEVKLVNFKGMSIREAQKWCKQNGLTLDVTDEGEEGGAIRKQSPAAGVKVAPGTTIYVVN